MEHLTLIDLPQGVIKRDPSLVREGGIDHNLHAFQFIHWLAREVYLSPNESPAKKMVERLYGGEVWTQEDVNQFYATMGIYRIRFNILIPPSYDRREKKVEVQADFKFNKGEVTTLTWRCPF